MEGTSHAYFMVVSQHLLCDLKIDMKNLSQDVYSFGQKLNLWTPKYVAALSAFISFIVYETPVFTSFQCPDGHFSDGALF
jgi:hypothetical protein